MGGALEGEERRGVVARPQGRDGLADDLVDAGARDGSGVGEPCRQSLLAGGGERVDGALRTAAGAGLEHLDERVALEPGKRRVDLPVRERTGVGEPQIVLALDVVAVRRPLPQHREHAFPDGHAATIHHV